jgi:serine/threonine protein kinase
MSDTDKKSDTIGFKSRGSTGTWKLRATQFDGTTSELFLVDGMTIGRTNANAIQADDDGTGVVERSHARVDFLDDGSVLLKCLHERSGVEAAGSTVSSLRLEIGSTFRIGRTQFEVVGSPTAEQVSIASVGRGCPYCGHADLPPQRSVATQCAACGKSIVVVPAERNLGVPTFLPGIFRDSEGKCYPVERFVARGGMGYVLKGHAEQELPVAIKVLIFDSNTNTQALSRFKQEIDLLRKMHDPNVLRLISHGQEAGLFFFAMEWVDGHDLRTELPVPGKPETHVQFSKALRWFEQACEGLSAIHRAGAVHRDIKPSNLLLRNDGQLLIADLGVAKRLNEGDTGMTCTGQLPGTYWYMAPEQHYAPDLVDQRTDIYSLGLTFWELLTGYRPNGVDPQPPSKANPTVPKEFDDILRTMLASRIDDRPGTMLDVLRSLPKPIIRPPGHVSIEPQPASVTAIAGSASAVSTAVTEPRNDTSAQPLGTGPTQAGASPDHIARGVAKVEATLRKCDSLTKAGLAFLRPRILELIRYIAVRAATLRQVVASTIASRATTSKPTSTSGNPDSASTSTSASASRAVTGNNPTVISTTHRPSARDCSDAATPALATDIAAQGQDQAGERFAFGETRPVSPSLDAVEKEQAAALEAEAAKVRENIRVQFLEAMALPEGSDERMDALRDALKIARSALALIPQSYRAAHFYSELKPEIELHLQAALRSIGDEAFAKKRHGLALFHYQELRQLSLADDLISDRIDQIVALRKAALEHAVATMRRGHLRDAREKLVRLQTDFLGDPSFIPECEQLLAKIRLIEQRVKETIPALRATKSLFRMSKLLEDLVADKIAISGLEQLLEKTRKTLSEGERRLERARSLVEEGKLEAARKGVAEVRAVISDHPVADELAGRIDAEEARQSQFVVQIRTLAEKHRFLRMHQILRQEDQKRVARLGLLDQFKHAATYKRRSDRFIRLVAWATGGSACMYVAIHLSQWLWSGIVSAVQNTAAGNFFQGSLEGGCLRFALFSLIAYLGLYGIRELLGRTQKTRSPVSDIIALVFTTSAVLATHGWLTHERGLKYLTQKLSEKGVAVDPAFLDNAGYWLVVACIGALYSSAIATFGRFGVDTVVPKAMMPLRPAIFLGIVLAVTGTFVPLGFLKDLRFETLETQGRILGIVPSVLLAMAVVSLCCQVRVRGVYGWLIVAAIVGFFLPPWTDVRQLSTLPWGLMGWIATLGCGVFLGMQNRTVGNAFLAGGIACIAVGSTFFLLGIDSSQEVLAQLLSWAAACVIVPTVSQQNVVKKLHLFERIREFVRSLQAPAAPDSPYDDDDVAESAPLQTVAANVLRNSVDAP